MPVSFCNSQWRNREKLAQNERHTRDLVAQEEQLRKSLEGAQATYRMLLERRESLQTDINALDSISRIKGRSHFVHSLLLFHLTTNVILIYL